MRFIGDFHIHSHYSRATSKQLVPEVLDFWGQRKGLAVIGSGDFTHPGWATELKEKLEPAEEGLFVLKNHLRGDNSPRGDRGNPDPAIIYRDRRTDRQAFSHGDTNGDRGTGKSVRFLLTAEISSIYKYGGKVRKVHNLIFAPSFETVDRIQKKIEHLGGNIRSDGRPILGLDSRDLLELCLEADERIFFVPAHIWTPWFSALGSKSGFDSIEECYRDLSPYIHAVETGLSSDPPMNWACSFLDRYTIISNSDAHSPEKLGREACLFETELSYEGIITALGDVRGGDFRLNGDRVTVGFKGTVELFPQEGKYHHDGHRKCGISWDPLTTLRYRGVCPVCGKPVTVGVLNRVASLADRRDITERPNRDPFYSLIPLKEILAEIEGVGSDSKRVAARYEDCLASLGPELDILLYRESEEIRKAMGIEVAEAIQRMRMRHVEVEAGYDGEYGKIRVGRGNGFFCGSGGTEEQPLGFIDFDLAAYRKLITVETDATERTGEDPGASVDLPLSPAGLNAEQQKAADYTGSPSLIIAGPGTGKTRTVVEKIFRLIRSGVFPQSVLAVTFANKAAGELRERLAAAGIAVEGSSVPKDNAKGGVQVSTFHSLGLSILKDHLPLLGRREGFFIIDEADKEVLLKNKFSCSAEEQKKMIRLAFRVKSGLQTVPGTEEESYAPFRDYQYFLKENNCFDYDDLVYLPVRLFESQPDILEIFQSEVAHIIIDEYQDINPMQYALLKAVSAKAEICAVGDPNQSIYAFRGGSPEFIQRFPEDFPGTEVFSLSQSYRCPETLLKASAQVLGFSEDNLSGPRKGVTITIFKQPTAASEAEQIARNIEEHLGGVGFFSFDSNVTGSGAPGNLSPSEIAVLCRASLQIPPLEKALNDHQIPFKTVRHGSLFAQEPYRSFLNFLRLLVSPETFPNVLIGSLAGLGRSSLEGLEAPRSLAEAVALFTSFVGPVEGLQKELHYFWTEGTGPEEFIVQARLGSDLDRYDRRLEAVTIMTMHASKGLEFKLVYIPGCEDTIIPCTMGGESAKDDAEEKRLLYVAMTRAKHEVVLSRAESRVIFGKNRHLPESPYLSLIEEELLRRRESEYERDRANQDRQLSFFD